MSNIEWTDETWNPVVGCTPVSPGCLNCYAATMARRLEAMGRPEYQPVTMSPTMRKEMGLRDKSTLTKEVRIAEVRDSRVVFTGLVRCLPERLEIPLRWKKPRMIFVNSMSDLFHEAVPFEFIDRVFAVMALCPRHTFQVLTKRPERMAEYLTSENRQPNPHAIDQVNTCSTSECIDVERDCVDIPGKFPGDHWSQPTRMEEMPWPLPNVWLGTSVEDQARAEERIPHLLRCPAAVRFLSVEPMLGPVDLTRIAWRSGRTVIDVDCLNAVVTSRLLGDSHQCEKDSAVHWAICGGESGANARAFDVAWARSLRDQCRAAGVPFFFKQMGSRPVQSASDTAFTMRWQWDDGGENVERWYMPIDRKGGDMSEWPEDLRVREMPGGRD